MSTTTRSYRLFELLYACILLIVVSGVKMGAVWSLAFRTYRTPTTTYQRLHATRVAWRLLAFENRRACYNIFCVATVQQQTVAC